MSHKTLENLAKAFAGESQARNRYTMYWKIAKQEGYEQIAAIFEETANQERMHAKLLFQMIQELKGDIKEIKIEAGVPTGFGKTEENLQYAAEGENYESEIMYPEFAKIAEEEGLMKIAAKFKLIAQAEKHHQERYEKLLKNIKEGKVFKKDSKVFWVCRECGYIYFSEEALEKCPCCEHEKSFMQTMEENF